MPLIQYDGSPTLAIVAQPARPTSAVQRKHLHQQMLIKVKSDRLTLRGEGGGLTPDGKSGKKSVFWGENLPKFHSMALRHCCSTELII